MRNHRPLLLSLLTLALTSACGGDTSTSPAPTNTTVAAPTATEKWSGTLPVGGAVFYSFVVTQNGTVNVTLVSVGGTAAGDVPATAALGLAIGSPSGTGCSGGSVTNAQPGTDPQVTGTYSPCRYCVNVSDVGNLPAPATFSVTIAHP
jgi:hypothetical protein